MKNDTIKGVLINPTKDTAAVEVLDKELTAYYRALNCQHIGITPRRIGGRDFQIVYNDAITAGAIPSAVSPRGIVEFYGNIFVVKYGNWDIDSLTDEEAEHVLQHVRSVDFDPKIRTLLTIEESPGLNMYEWYLGMCEAFGND